MQRLMRILAIPALSVSCATGAEVQEPAQRRPAASAAPANSTEPSGPWNVTPQGDRLGQASSGGGGGAATVGVSGRAPTTGDHGGAGSGSATTSGVSGASSADAGEAGDAGGAGGGAPAPEESAAGLATSGGQGGAPSQPACPSETRARLANGECVDRFEELAIAKTPMNIAITNDGTIWFSDHGTHEIIAIDQEGTVLRRIPLPEVEAQRELLSGDDSGDVVLWYTDSASQTLSQVTRSGETRSFKIGNYLTGIALAPNGHLFAADMLGKAILEVAPTGELLNRWDAGPSSTITTDPEGNVWYPQSGNQTMGYLSSTGEPNEFRISGGVPNDLTAGPDDAVWFVDGFYHQVGRIDSGGLFRCFDLAPTSSPQRIVKGRDGVLWFTEFAMNQIGRVVGENVRITHYPVPTQYSAPYGIAVAPDGTVWFTESASGKIGRLIPDAPLRP